jgi:hypothetical protein
MPIRKWAAVNKPNFARSVWLRLSETPQNSRRSELDLHQRQILERGQAWSAFRTQIDRKSFGNLYGREVARYVQGTNEVKPASIVVFPRGAAAIVVNLAVLRGIDSQRIEERKVGFRKDVAARNDEISASIAGTLHRSTRRFARISVRRGLPIARKLPGAKRCHLC